MNLWPRGVINIVLLSKFCRLVQISSPTVLATDSASLSTTVSGVEQTGAICRAKRSKCVYLPADSGDSLEYEAAPSGHIEISAFPVDTRLHAESLIEENTSGFTDEVSDSSETHSSDSGSDSSETEPDMDEEMPLLSGYTFSISYFVNLMVCQVARFCCNVFLMLLCWKNYAPILQYIA